MLLFPIKLVQKGLLGIFLNGLALYFLTLVLPEIEYTGGYACFIVGGIVMGLLNSFAKPIVKIFTLPLIFISAGLFLIVINAGFLYFLSYFLDVLQFREVSFYFPNLGSYVIGAIVFGAINWAQHLLVKNKL